MSAIAPTRPDLSQDNSTGLGRPWNVIVRNDDHNTFSGVAGALSAVIPGVNMDRGFEFADAVHRTGQAIVWTGHLEAAELYHEQLLIRGLTMAPLEQAD